MAYNPINPTQLTPPRVELIDQRSGAISREWYRFFLSLLTATQTNPLDQAGNEWKYKYVPYACVVEVLHRATAVGMVFSITSGSDDIMQSSPVPSGGTAGVPPARLNVEPITFKANAGDVLQIVYRNTTGGTITVDGTIELTKV